MRRALRRAAKAIVRGLLAAAAATACGGLGVAPAADVRVVTSAPSPEADALVAQFFGGSALPADFDARLTAALAKSPDSGALHEVAAYWAVLGADDHAAWEHFLRAAADTRNADAALDIAELGRVDRTTSEMLATVETLGQVSAATADPLVRARAEYTRAAFLRVLGEFAGASEAMGTLGFVREALLMGPFDNEDGKGLAEAYPPEAKVDVAATVPGSVLPIRWRKAASLDAYGTIPLHALVYPNQGAVAYTAFWVQVEGAAAATPAKLRLSSEAPVAAWVNHAEVARQDQLQRWGLDNVTASVTLQPGWNEVLVKSAVKTGSWNLAVRFTDAAGRPIAGLSTSASPPPVAPAVASAGPASRDDAIPVATDRRQAFAIARALVLGGLTQPGLGRLERLLAAATANPLLRLYTSSAAAQDHQAERALDLLASAIAETSAPVLPAFLEARASLYLQKELLQQAERDLVRVVATHPNARIARVALADALSRLTWQADRVAVLRDVTRRWPDSANAFVNLASAREAQGYSAQAEEAYRRATELEPANATAWRALWRLLEARGAIGEAERVYAKLAIISPVDVGDRLAHAEHERTRGHTATAEAILAAISELTPEHPTPYLRRGQLAEEQGKEALAIALFQEAQDRDPRDSWIAQRLEHLRPPADDALRPYVATDEEIERAVHRRSAKGDAASHVEVLLSDTATLLSSDGSIRVVATEVLRALTQRGRDELVHMGLPGGASARVMKAYAETPDGRRQEASSVERTSLRFRNLEVGSTVVLQYAAYPRRTGALSDDYFHDMPFATLGRHVDRMRWVVVASKQKPLQVDVDPRVTHKETDTGAWVVHEMVREDVPAIPAELSMVPVADLQPHVVVTTVPSWDSFIRWERAILAESFPIDPAIDALAARLTAGATTPREKLGRLFAFTAQEIRYQQEYESILAGWQPHRSSVVLERKYGDCKDKATLLIALARAVGVEVQFVVLATHGVGHPDRKVVLPYFNHAIAYVPEQPGIPDGFFLDATVDALDLWNLREDDQGAAALVLDPKSGAFRWVQIPYQDPSFQTEAWRVNVEVTSPEKVEATAHFDIRGSHAASIRALLRNEDQSRQVFDVLAAAFFPGGRVVSASAPDHESLLHPLAIEEQIDLAASIRREGEHYRLRVPNDTDTSLTRLTDRQTPLDLGPQRSSSAEIVVHLGPDVHLVETPASVLVVDPCFEARRAVTVVGATVTLKDEMRRTCTEVKVADYPRYRAAMDRARSLLDVAVVFDKGGSPKRAAR